MDLHLKVTIQETPCTFQQLPTYAFFTFTITCHKGGDITSVIYRKLSDYGFTTLTYSSYELDIRNSSSGIDTLVYPAFLLGHATNY